MNAVELAGMIPYVDNTAHHIQSDSLIGFLMVIHRKVVIVNDYTLSEYHQPSDENPQPQWHLIQ